MQISLTEINRAEVLQYLNWRGSEIPPEVAAQLDGCMSEALSRITPRTVWRLFPCAEAPEGLLVGGDIQALLAGCKQFVLLAATLGGGIENAIRQAQVRDLTRALILDCCGSSAIESVCDRAEEGIRAALGGGVFLTDRFSPGYGDLPLSVQPVLLDLVDAPRRIGLHLTPSGILTPRKSVTAVIGVSDSPQTRRFRGCAYCSMFGNCSYRKAGKTCGKAS